jgi:hypothetical protein
MGDYARCKPSWSTDWLLPGSRKRRGTGHSILRVHAVSRMRPEADSHPDEGGVSTRECSAHGHPAPTSGRNGIRL